MSSSEYSNVIKVFLYLANIFEFDKDHPRSTFHRIFHPENLFTCLENIKLRVNFLNEDGYFISSMNNLYLKMDNEKQQISKCNNQKIEDFKININNLNKTLQAYYNSVADIVLTNSPYIKKDNKINRMELGGLVYKQILKNSIDVMIEKNKKYMKEDPDADSSSEEEDADSSSKEEQDEDVSGQASSREWTPEEMATKRQVEGHMQTLTDITKLREETSKAKHKTAKQAAAEAAKKAAERAAAVEMLKNLEEAEREEQLKRLAPKMGLTVQELKNLLTEQKAAETAQSKSSLPVRVVNENSRAAAAAAVEAAEAAVNAQAEAAVNAEAEAKRERAVKDSADISPTRRREESSGKESEAQAATTRGRGTTATVAEGSAAARAKRRMNRSIKRIEVNLGSEGGRKKKRPTKKKPTKKRPTKRRKSTIKRTNTKKRSTKRRR